MKTSFLFISLALFFTACEKSDSAATADSAMSAGTGLGGSLARFTVIGNYLYLADLGELKVYDISSPQQTVLASAVYTGTITETIFPYGDKLFIGGSTGVEVYSLADPAHPLRVGQAAHLRSCDPVVANDSIAFVTLTGTTRCGPATDGLYIYRTLGLSNNTQIYLQPIPTLYGLGLADSVLYVCQRANGMSVFNISQPALPVLRKKLTNYHFNDVIPYGNLLICYVSNGLVLYDITTRSNPVFISEVLN